MSDHYILENRVPKAVDALTWSRSLYKKERQIGFSPMPVGRVSTVFLGLDHSFGQGPPVLFEMMVFISEEEKGEVQLRCRTYDEAKELHFKGIRKARSWHHCPEGTKRRSFPGPEEKADGYRVPRILWTNGERDILCDS